MKKLLFLAFIAITVIGCSPKMSPDSSWGNQRWVLIELKEVPVQLSNTNRDAFIEFSTYEKRFSGNGGCNRISGNYSLEKKSKIRFSEVISTKMSCPDIAFENTFLSAINEVNRFEVDGENLLLKDDNEILIILRRRSSF